MDFWKLFFKKNLKRLQSDWLSLLVVLIISLLLFFFYLCGTQAKYKYAAKDFDSTNIDSFYHKAFLGGGNEDFLFYYPSDEFTDKLMDKVREKLEIPMERVFPFDSKSDMFLNLEEKQGTHSFAIYFESYPPHSGHSRSLNYTLTSTFLKVPTWRKFYNDDNVVSLRDYDDYVSSGYFLLEHAIDYSFYSLTTQNARVVQIDFSPMPHIDVEGVSSTRLHYYGIMYTLMFYILLLVTYIIPTVEENETGITDYLMLATTKHYLNEITFFIIRFLLYLIVAIVCMIIAVSAEATGNAPLFLLFILKVFFILTSMIYAHLLTSFFKTAFSAKIGGFMILMGPCLTFALEPYNYASRIFVCIFNGNTFMEGIRIFQIYSNKHRDFTFFSLFENVIEYFYKMIVLYLIFFLQSVLYIMLYYFITFKLSGNGRPRKREEIFIQASCLSSPELSHSNDENDSDSIEEVIELKNLRKEFKQPFQSQINVAVDNLNMKITNKCITVLLGHNGAGKTTVINMIVGNIPQTSGDIIIGNKENFDIQHFIGYCPQNNIFMSYMTVKEHLEFFSELRGLSKFKLKEHVEELLQKLKLNDRADEYATKLSGGMKRRLSLSIAVSGHTKIVILDEPSSGLDPESRRIIWDILLDLRKTKAILITTHHMEEAEILGDNISILSNGKLIRSGTVIELKHEYGSGYLLKLLINPDSDRFDEHYCIKEIQKFIPNAEKRSYNPPQLLITLPFNERPNYFNLIKYLEDHLTKLGLQSLSITDTTLDEVFLNCEYKSNGDLSPSTKIDINDVLDETDSNIRYGKLKNESMDSIKNNTINKNLLMQQLWGIFYKKYVFIRLNITILIALIPFIAVILSFTAIFCSDIAFDDSRPIKIDLKNSASNSTIYFKLEPNFHRLKNCLAVELQNENIHPIFIEGERESLELTLIEEQKLNLTYFYDDVIGAIKIGGDPLSNLPKISILYSLNQLHSSVALLNLVDNIFLRDFECSGGNIETWNIPFTKAGSFSKKTSQLTPYKLDFYANIMPIGLFLTMLCYILLPHYEEKSGFKDLQPVKPFWYWIFFTIFDLFVHFCCCLFMFLPHILFLSFNFYNGSEIFLLLIAYFFYGLAYLPFLYIIGRCFQTISSLASFLIFMLIASTITPLLTSNNEESMKEYEIVIFFMSFLPDFLLKHQIKLINENYFIHRRNELAKSKTMPANLTGKQTMELNTFNMYFYAIIIFLCGEIFLIFIWDNIDKRTALKEFLSYTCCCCYKKLNLCKKVNETSKDDPKEDQVLLERDKVNKLKEETSRKDDYPLVVDGVSKRYDTVSAVRDVSFLVETGECFGLLGLNGAGKTSLFKMIIGSENITNGEITIKGLTHKNNFLNYTRSFGYCPQTDSLNDFMTPYEILKYMALIRGVDSMKIDSQIDFILNELNLYAYKNRVIKNFSGGTKRKLSTAIAIIGDPQLILLDEPTTGVDPVSRRSMWNVIRNCQKQSKTVILTSHSMDECEKLCGRLAIMANGQFQCIGYIPELKLRYGKGYTFYIKLKNRYCSNKIKEQIHNYLLDIMLREEHDQILTFVIKSSRYDLWRFLRNLDHFCNDFEDSVDDYSISEASLEDIFLNCENLCRNSCMEISNL